jgi:hypothetical protein
MEVKRWIAVDFDGTLATFGCNWQDNPKATGEPVQPMVELVKKWLADGEDVRIFTARMDRYHPKYPLPIPLAWVIEPIEQWCVKHIGQVLPITNVKDYFCKALYDDRAIQVEKDTGRLIHD